MTYDFIAVCLSCSSKIVFTAGLDNFEFDDQMNIHCDVDGVLTVVGLLQQVDDQIVGRSLLPPNSPICYSNMPTDNKLNYQLQGKHSLVNASFITYKSI